MTKLAPEWVRTSDPLIRSPACYRWTTAPPPPPPQGMRHSLCRELRGQKFSPGEDLEAFVDNIVRQGRTLGLTDRLIMDEILMALPTDMANTISQHDPKTVEDIIHRK